MQCCCPYVHTEHPPSHAKVTKLEEELLGSYLAYKNIAWLDVPFGLKENMHMHKHVCCAMYLALSCFFVFVSYLEVLRHPPIIPMSYMALLQIRETRCHLGDKSAHL